MSMKGQVPIMEMITVIIALFVSFSIFFPERNFGNRWQEAEVALKGRDVVTSMDRSGGVATYVSNEDSLRQFINRTVSNNLVYWTTIEGTVQPDVIVACNCTTSQIQDLTNYIGRLKLNGREILLDIRPSTLSPIQKSNVLIIWGRTNLSAYRNDILNYMRDGGGVIGIADVTDPDTTYTEIFGVKRCSDVFGAGPCVDSGSSQIDFRYTTNSSKPAFQVDKYFFHLPIRDLANLSTFPITVETNQTCPNTQVFEGRFTFKSTIARYWICNSTDVFMDTNGNLAPDIILKENSTFSVRDVGTGVTYNFKMSYIDAGGNRTYISFRSNPLFRFDDSGFRPSSVMLYPSDRDDDKVILYDGSYGNGRPIPAATINNSLPGKAIWATDFLGATHDYRLLMASLVFSASKKKTVETTLGDLKVTGAITPYINVVNRDMLEIYQFNLGLGFPF
jgi:hypothetical protein